MLGYVAGDMLGSPRSLYALGARAVCLRRRSRACILASTRRTWQSWFYAMLIAALAVSSSFTQLAMLREASRG